MRDVVDFFLVPRLWIAKENRLELLRFRLTIQRKIDRGGQGTGGWHAGILQLGRSLRFVEVIESRQLQPIDRRAITAGFNDE